VKKEDYNLALDSLRKCADLKQSDAPRAMLEAGQLAERSIDLYGTLPAYKAWFEQYQWAPVEAQAWAIERFEKAIELKPDYAEAWLALAKARQQRKEYDQAISAAKEATRLAPRDWWGWFVLGTCYIAIESYAEAIAALQQAEKIAPEQGDTVAPDVQKGMVLLSLGEAYAGKGDREQVFRIYQELKNTNTKMAEDFFKWYVLPHPESARP
ncbi:MAG: tetratricopeptide repeat protein, partial [Candidatus Acidiferrum sp.]